jgi:hypothetical protein
VDRKGYRPSVAFRFLWENTTDNYVVLNANGYMTLFGFCSIWSGGGAFGGNRSSKITITPTLELFDWTTAPYRSFGKAEILAVDMRTNTSTTWDDADGETTIVFRGYDLSLSLILVPPRTMVGLVMTVAMHSIRARTAARSKPIFRPVLSRSAVQPSWFRC